MKVDDDDEDVPNGDMSCMLIGVFVTTLNKRMIKRATLKRWPTPSLSEMTLMMSGTMMMRGIPYHLRGQRSDDSPS